MGQQDEHGHQHATSDGLEGSNAVMRAQWQLRHSCANMTNACKAGACSQELTAWRLQYCAHSAPPWPSNTPNSADWESNVSSTV
eukprot:1150334-Pelagomonas_calceolata.AAC.6